MEEPKQESKQKIMRAVRQKTVEEVVEATSGQLIIENIVIAGKEYKLKLSNSGGRLSLDFNEQDYVITIDEKGITFGRTAYRPEHDHNDFEHLLVGVDDRVMGIKKGEVIWFSRFPYQSEGRDFFRVEFGAVTKGY